MPSISDYANENHRLNQELTTLKALVREMGKILKAALSLTLTASDWAMRYKIKSLNDEALAVNAMFFADDDEGILSRPEVKKIMEDKP